MSHSQNRALNLFVSFAPADAALQESLLKHLAVLRQIGDVHYWGTDSIPAGTDRRRELDRALEHADVALLLLSADFLASELIQDIEVPRVLERYEKRGLRVIPVLLRTCAWQLHPWLGKLRALPRSGIAVAAHDADQRDQVLTEIVKEIAKLAADGQQPSPQESPHAAPPRGDSIRSSAPGITNYRAPLLIAIVLAIGAIGAAIVANWDRTSPTTTAPQPIEPGPPKPPPAQGIPSISGTWQDLEYPSNGSQFSQEGDRFRFTRWGTLPTGDSFESSGSGTIVEQSLSGSYSAKYRSGATSTGKCSGTVSTDGTKMNLTCTDSLLSTFTISSIRR